MKNFTKEQIEEAISKTTSMFEASQYLKVNFKTFRTYAKKFGLFTPVIKPNLDNLKTFKIDLQEILSGNHPQYQSNKLRMRLISEGIFKPECFICKLDTWLNKQIPLELDHIDGNKHNNLLSNLRLLCPNCHAQTETYCGKNIGRY